MTASLFILGLFWALWCCVHSAMISLVFARFLKTLLGDNFRYYRLFFNAFALATLVPVLVYERSLDGPVLFEWQGPLVFVRALLLAVALMLFFAGARHYDMSRFLGLRQGQPGKGLTEAGDLDTTGVLAIVRHPWYAGAMLLIWTSTIDGPRLVTNMILTAYLVIGAALEERKLIAEYGDAYQKYQEEVPMLLPRLKKKTARAKR